MGDRTRVAALLDADRRALDRPCPNTGVTPLMCAVRCGRAALAEELLRRGAHIGRRRAPALDGTGGGDTALHLAVAGPRMGREPLVDRLLGAGADVDAIGASGWRPLHVAARWDHTGAASRLLAAGADPTARDDRDLIPLDVAAAAQHWEVAQVLQNADDEVNRFLVACTDGDVAQVRRRLSAQPSLVRVHDATIGSTPLINAAARGRIDILRVLLDAGAPVDGRELGTGRTALHAAAEGGFDYAAAVLLGAGAATDTRDEAAGQTPLGALLARPQSERTPLHEHTFRILRSHGAALDLFCGVYLADAALIAAIVADDPTRLEQRSGWETGHETPLHAAVARDDTAVTAALLAAGADGMAVSGDGRSVLCVAAERGNRVIEEVLREYGVQDDLSVALLRGNRLRAGMLLAAAPDRIRPGGRQSGLLHGLVERGDIAAVELVLQHGADLEQRATIRYGALPVRMSALHHAALRGNARIVRLLIQFGADVDARAGCHLNPTSLMLAAVGRDVDTMQALLDAGADTSLRDTRRQLTALEWARSVRSTAIVDLLESRGIRE
jgi:ankyrin repeat protein